MNQGKTRNMVLAGLFAALTALGAFWRVPLGAASFTLQFLFTALAGILLKPQWSGASQAAYVAIGLVGLPVFAAGGGFGYIFQPSFGFLLGLIPSAWVIGMLSRGTCSPVRLGGACLAGLAVLYMVGVPYLYCILNWYMGVETSWAGAIYTGMLVYLPGDIIKIVAVVAVGYPVRKRMAHLLE